MTTISITIVLADQKNFGLESMDQFDRYQQVTNVIRLINGELTTVYQPFTADWSPARRREKAQ